MIWRQNWKDLSLNANIFLGRKLSVKVYGYDKTLFKTTKLDFIRVEKCNLYLEKEGYKHEIEKKKK